ncbi:MAG: hypothetical protein JW704_08650 [Anaerolineaceae bacterium]|nr:hypothetical protein [Anaerolineaceae bacterium]MBN2678043.1 hypothetical protein [Anaerolineaceae bacterium]
MKKIRLSVTLLILAGVILSCSLFQRPVVTEGPPFEVWTPTSEVPVVATVEVVGPTTEVIAPTLEIPAYTRAQIGTYQSIWVTYDPGSWNAIPWIVSTTNQAGEAVQQLVHLTFAGCSLHDNLGHGVPDFWSYAGFTREIGGVVFSIDQWTNVNTNNPDLVIYQYPAGEMTNDSRRLELETGSQPFDCIAVADGVLALSIPDLIP